MCTMFKIPYFPDFVNINLIFFEKKLKGLKTEKTPLLPYRNAFLCPKTGSNPINKNLNPSVNIRSKVYPVGNKAGYVKP